MSTPTREAAKPLPRQYVAAIHQIPLKLSSESLEASLRLCAPLHQIRTQSPRNTITLNLPYGPDERHLLDIHYAPGAPTQGQPFVLFVHGGGFVGGNRHVPGSFLYANVAAWANRCGFAAALMSYRLAPSARWPAGAEDVERAFRWLARNSAQLGLSGDRCVVIGHSAGAAHVASWLAGHHGETLGCPPIRGAVLISGIYKPSLLPFPGAFAYYGDDLSPNRYSSVGGIGKADVPLFLAAANLDPPEFKLQWRLAQETRAASQGGATTSFIVPNQNHFTSVYHLGAQPDELGVEMSMFIRRCSAN